MTYKFARPSLGTIALPLVLLIGFAVVLPMGLGGALLAEARAAAFTLGHNNQPPAADVFVSLRQRMIRVAEMFTTDSDANRLLAEQADLAEQLRLIIEQQAGQDPDQLLEQIGQRQSAADVPGEQLPGQPGGDQAGATGERQPPAGNGEGETARVADDVAEGSVPGDAPPGQPGAVAGERNREAMAEALQTVWGHLPPQTLQRLLDPGGAQAIPRYRALTEQYYRRMAQEDD